MPYPNSPFPENFNHDLIIKLPQNSNISVVSKKLTIIKFNNIIKGFSKSLRANVEMAVHSSKNNIVQSKFVKI